VALFNTQNSKLKIKAGWFLKVLILVVCLWLVFILLERALQRIALVQIAELTNTKIEAYSIDFGLDGSVIIEGLAVRPHQEHRYDDAILKAERVYARFGIGSLLLLRPRLKEISVNDFVFDAQYDLDTGRWNVAALKIKAAKGDSGRIPVIRLERGTLRYSKVSEGRVEVAAAMPVDARFAPDEETGAGYSFDIITAERGGSGKSILSGLWRPGRVTISGGISSADIASLERVWTIDDLAAELDYDRNDAFSLKLRIKDLVSTHTDTDGTFALGGGAFSDRSGPVVAFQKFFSRYQPTGTVDIGLEASGNLQQLGESTLVGEAYCKDVSICYYRFPYAVERLSGRIDLTENSAVLNNLSGEHGDVRLFFNGWSRDFAPSWKYQIQITSDNMALDGDLYEALSTKQKRFWSVFSPSGLAAIDYRRDRSGAEKKWSLAVELLDVEAAYRRFPYPLKNLAGNLFFDSNSITISDVVSQVSERKIAIDGRVTGRRTGRPIYDISIIAKDVPLDSTLGESLSDRQRYLYNRLDMDGLADVEVKVLTPEDEKKAAGFTANVSLKNGSFKVPVLQENHEPEFVEAEEFPLVISDVSDRTVITDDSIYIEDLTGRCSEGLVCLTGRIWPGGADEPRLSEGRGEQVRYCLSLDAERVRISDGLFSLLPGSLEEVVYRLQPEGSINCRADLNKNGGADCPDYKVTVDCLGNSVGLRFAKRQSHEAAGELEPSAYPLKDVTGSITVTRDSIELKDIAARVADDVEEAAADSSINIDGRAALADGGFNSGRFTVYASDILLDERLGLALPEDVWDYYEGVSPTGRFDLDLEDVKIFSGQTGERYVDFNGIAVLKGCAFDTTAAISGLDAVLILKGSYKTGGWFRRGEGAVIAERLKIKGKSLTALKANLRYDPSRRSWVTENLVADCYDGKVTGKLELKRPIGSAPEYLIQVGFDNIDLKQFLSDTKLEGAGRDGYTSGEMDGSLGVGAVVGGAADRIGRCRLRITDMRVGKLSPLAKLLYVLKLTEPGDFAFDRMLVDSYVKGDRLFFQQFDLSGKALAFNGSGYMDLQSEDVDLTLTARGRRLGGAEPSLLQSLTEGLGQAVVRMKVTGNIYDPKITTTTLPVIGDTLKILGTPH